MTEYKILRQKAAAKMHPALNMRSFLPNFVIVKSVKGSAPKTTWKLCTNMKVGDIVVFDKAYVDFKHLKALATCGVYARLRTKYAGRAAASAQFHCYHQQFPHNTNYLER